MKHFFVFSLLAAAAAIPSFASTVYEGTDTACFYTIPASSCTETGSASGTGIDTNGGPLLTYTPDSTPFSSTGGGEVTLGTFSVASTFAGGDAAAFDLDVTFTQPGNGQETYSAITLGTVVFAAGGAEITFNQPTTELFTTSGGSFDLTLPSAPILVGEGDTVNLNGWITPVTATPEPASLGTIAGGLMLLGIAVYRKRSAATATQN